MNTKDNQRVKLTKRMLQDTLLHLLREKALDQLSVSELCQRASINRTTFYRHYGCIGDVLAEMEDALIAAVKKRVEEYPLAGEQELRKRLETCAVCLRENEELSRLLLVNNVDPGFAEKVLRVTRIQQELDEYFAPRYDAESRRLVSAYMLSGCFSMIRCWLLENSGKTPGQVADLLLEMFPADRKV